MYKMLLDKTNKLREEAIRTGTPIIVAVQKPRDSVSFTMKLSMNYPDKMIEIK